MGKKTITLILLYCSLVASIQAQTPSTLLTNALVYDGSGAEPYQADVLLKSGIIFKISPNAEDLKDLVSTIDLKGKALAPGFIDLHSHAEQSLLAMPHLDNLVQQGITTILGGNCGFSPHDFQAFFSQVAPLAIGPNLALLVGHNSIREAVMGREQRLATEQELQQMRALIAKAMGLGAFGLSTGLKYVPGVYSDQAEVVALAQETRSYQGFFTSHMRDEGSAIFSALDEVFAVATTAHIPVHISHHKIIGAPNWGQAKQSLARINEMRNQGHDITLDQYPYTASSTRISILFPPWALAGSNEQIQQRLVEPSTRAKIKAAIIENIRTDRGGGDPARLQIAHFAANPQWDGKNFSQILSLRAQQVSIENAAELAMYIEQQGGAQGIFHAIDEGDVQQIMQYAYTSIATDAAGANPDIGQPHPRSYGTFPRVLGHYVRELKLLSLAQGIHKMTGLPAQRMGLTDRGLIKEGYAADLVVFDPATIADQATFISPHQDAIGITYVFINGQIAKSPQGLMHVGSGQILRHKVDSEKLL
jgi:dihydroorotase/N-acyl-D-amino-acid deacylase